MIILLLHPFSFSRRLRRMSRQIRAFKRKRESSITCWRKCHDIKKIVNRTWDRNGSFRRMDSRLDCSAATSQRLARLFVPTMIVSWAFKYVALVADFLRLINFCSHLQSLLCRPHLLYTTFPHLLYCWSDKNLCSWQIAAESWTRWLSVSWSKIEWWTNHFQRQWLEHSHRPLAQWEIICVAAWSLGCFDSSARTGRCNRRLGRWHWSASNEGLSISHDALRLGSLLGSSWVRTALSYIRTTSLQ